VLAAALFSVATAPILTEIPAPKNHTLFIPLAISADGQVVFEADRADGTMDIFVWKEGKTVQWKYADEKGYGLDPKAAQSNGVNGFLADGSFYGFRVFAFNGASSSWMSRPFLAKGGLIKPLVFPSAMKGWNDIEPVAVRPDGTFLIRGLEETTNGMMGDPKKWIDELMWVKEGKLLGKLGFASGPLLDKQGNVVAATQYVDEDGDIAGEGVYNRRASVVLFKNGKFERVTDGQVVALLDNGDIIFRRQTYSAADQQYDTPDKVTFHRLRDGAVSDFAVPGQPEFPRLLFLDAEGHGMVQGWNGDTEVFRSFDETTFHDVVMPTDLTSIDVSAYSKGWFAISGEDKSGNFRIFVGSGT
jgi:hypothetical protein